MHMAGEFWFITECMCVTALWYGFNFSCVATVSEVGFVTDGHSRLH
jgi:hypothetical protein